MPLVASSFSSTLVADSVSDLTLLASPFPLAQCPGLEMGQTSKGDVSILEDDSLSQKSLHWLSHILRRLLLRSFVVIL